MMRNVAFVLRRQESGQSKMKRGRRSVEACPLT